MAETGMFISSCSRRELARGRPGSATATLLTGIRQLLIALIVGGIGFGVFVVARGGL
jgi:hypothetical protein